MDSILFSIEDGVAIITLNRPEKYNAFNREMAFRMHEILDQCAGNVAIRCVYITGSGKAFCSGQDLSEVVDPKGPGMNRILNEHYNPIVSRIKTMEKPFVAAVNGVAAGAGANIALCCDVVVAADSASFIQSFTGIGLIPDSGGTFNLPRLIGWQKASALMLLGDKVSAADAEHMGMIYKVFAAESFQKEATAIAHKLAALPAKALAYTKLALKWSATHTFKEQLENEDKLQQRAASTPDFKEGVKAFLEKRKPEFNGE